MSQFGEQCIHICLLQNMYDRKITTDKAVQTTWSEFFEELCSEHDISDEKDGTAIIGASIKSQQDGAKLYTDNDGNVVFDEYGAPIIHRLAENIDHYYLLGIDIDDGMTIEAVKNQYQEYEYIGCTTYNHQPDMHKLRLFFLLKTPVTPEDINIRKDAILEWAGSADPTTLDIARLFYIPACPEERLPFAEIWHNEGKLLDILDFDNSEKVNKDKIPKSPTNDTTEFSLGTKDTIKRGLMTVGRVAHEEYYRIAAAMHHGGMSLQDFIEVSTVLKPSKTSAECMSQWKNSSKLLSISPKFLFNFLNKHGFNVSSTDTNADQDGTALLTAEVNLLDLKIEHLDNQPNLTASEKGAQLNILLQEKVNKERELDSQEKDQDGLEAKIQQLLAERLIYYVMDSDIIMEYEAVSGQWMQYKVSAFINGEPFLMERGGKVQLLQQLKQLGRSFKTHSLSARVLPNHTLNMFRNDHWLQPIAGQHHEVFDLLVRSIGDNKPENMRHLKQVIAWKYLNPGDYKLPCIVAYGEGGAGKNTLVEVVLGAIYGEHQVLAVQQESLKDFNGHLSGKMAVLIDESTSDKADMEKLKAMIGRKYININPKYGKEYVVDNISQFFTGGNGALGAVFLGRDKSDRRFSIMHISRSLIEHVMEVKQLSRNEAVTWWTKRENILGQPDEVAKWLHHILDEVSELTTRPEELHGQDYERLLAAQAGPLEWLFDFVFDRPSFEFISGKECYELYQLKCAEDGVNRKMARSTFEAKLSDKLNQQYPEIVYKKQQKVQVANTISTRNGWVVKGNTGAIDVTSQVYVSDDPADKHKRVIVYPCNYVASV